MGVLAEPNAPQRISQPLEPGILLMSSLGIDPGLVLNQAVNGEWQMRLVKPQVINPALRPCANSLPSGGCFPGVEARQRIDPNRQGMT